MGPTNLVALENKPGLHNLVVCTLCSCYPRMLLGLPPDWYKSRNYRSRAVREPRAVLTEFGTPIPDDVEVRVHDSTADMRYLVIPERPTETEDLDEAALAELVTRDSMIGVARARSPQQ
jgi:nitrile hydratase